MHRDDVFLILISQCWILYIVVRFHAYFPFWTYFLYISKAGKKIYLKILAIRVA